MIGSRVAMAIARLRDKARGCRRLALGMESPVARAAMERIAARWELMAEIEGKAGRRLVPANEP